MNADPAAQLHLLDLQRVVTALTQLQHRRSTLPELAKIAAASERADAVQIDQVDARTGLTDIDTEQRRLENEVDAVRTRASRDGQRLAGGGLPAKELEGLQHEISSLARRQGVLEDDLLEVMEQREAVESRVNALDAELAGLSAERQELESARDATFAEIDAAAAERARERAEIAALLPADLLALYDKVAAASGGVGAAALKQRRCEGCHLELAGNDLINLRAAAPEAVVRCENCRRILVRTAESGL